MGTISIVVVRKNLKGTTRSDRSEGKRKLGVGMVVVVVVVMGVGDEKGWKKRNES